MSEKLTSVDQRTIRLISSANHKPPVLEPLASSFGARKKLEDLEGVTSGRQIVQQHGVPGIAADAFARGYGYTYINAAFAYCRPDGNRFNAPEWGAWYSAFHVETALQEVAFHLTVALQNAGAYYDNVTHYIELLATFSAEFYDVCGIDPLPDYLNKDTATGYPAGQRLATDVRARGYNGILYPSVRHEGGKCLVAFWPALIQNFQQGETWILTWAGDATPTISRSAK